jgi:hypothetical protein
MVRCESMRVTEAIKCRSLALSPFRSRRPATPSASRAELVCAWPVQVVPLSCQNGQDLAGTHGSSDMATDLYRSRSQDLGPYSSKLVTWPQTD